MKFDKTQTLTLGHSPDPDDAFMFYAMAQNKIDLRGYTFEHKLLDIETLNQLCLKNQMDISAVSFHTLAFIQDNYEVLPCGASMGDGYGPILVATQDSFSKNNAELAKQVLTKKIAIPGEHTSAFLSLLIYLNENLPENITREDLNYDIVPFDEIFARVKNNEVDLGLIIHEGQITYSEAGFINVLDLGVWWQKLTDLPLPLGCNVINKRIPETNRKEISAIIKQSIIFALEQSNKNSAVTASMQYARDLDFAKTDKFVNMYVNDYTIDLGEKGNKAVKLFHQKARQFKLL